MFGKKKTEPTPVVEEKMDLVRDICSLGRFAREDAKIKVRQPISEVLLDSNVSKLYTHIENH